MKILSLDGGGVYGAHTITIIKRIEDKFPGFIDKIDLFSGTSIGGIIALGLANGSSPNKIFEYFTKYASDMFYRTSARKIKSHLGLCSKYSQDKMKSLLVQEFGDKRLYHLDKNVIIQAFDIQSWQGKLFHNFTFDKILKNNRWSEIRSLNPMDQVEKIVDVALATSAAPTYYPAYNGYIDGGVIQNNPSMQSIAFLRNNNLLGGKTKIRDMRLLSIGRTYYQDNKFKYEPNLDAGYIRWFPTIIDLLMSAGQTCTDYQCHEILKDNYWRVGDFIPKELSKDFDEVSIIPKLIDYSNSIDLSEEFKWVELNIMGDKDASISDEMRLMQP